MQKITPFLWFDKNCEEALTFYTSIFKDAKIEHIKRYPVPPNGGKLEAPIKGMEGKILTAVFTLEGQRFMALDGGPHFKPTGAVSFLVECKDQPEIDYYWDKLTAGGDPNQQQCGWLQDKFGFSWQIVPDMTQFFNETDPIASDRALQVMLQMKKIDMATLQKAYDQK